MKYIDIHSHLTFKDFDPDREEVLARMADAEVGSINIAVDAQSSKEVIELAEKHTEKSAQQTTPALRAIVGLHPLYVATCKNKESVQEEIATITYLATSSSTVVGIGECGLDFFRLKGETPEEIKKEKELQEYAFRLQIEMAIALNKPLMIHCRDAYPEVLAILREYKEKCKKNGSDDICEKKLRVNFHFFAGNKEELTQIIAMGFYVSFTGVVTFAKDYEELVRLVPKDRIMIETDCPYVAPTPHRGKRNEPVFVIDIAKKIAEIVGEDEEVMSKQILENTKQFFIDFS